MSKPESNTTRSRKRGEAILASRAKKREEKQEETKTLAEIIGVDVATLLSDRDIRTVAKQKLRAEQAIPYDEQAEEEYGLQGDVQQQEKHFKRVQRHRDKISRADKRRKTYESLPSLPRTRQHERFRAILNGIMLRSATIGYRQATAAARYFAPKVGAIDDAIADSITKIEKGQRFDAAPEA